MIRNRNELVLTCWISLLQELLHPDDHVLGPANWADPALENFNLLSPKEVLIGRGWLARDAHTVNAGSAAVELHVAVGRTQPCTNAALHFAVNSVLMPRCSRMIGPSGRAGTTLVCVGGHE